MAKRISPRQLVAQVAALLAERENLTGLGNAAEWCVQSLLSGQALDRERTLLLASLLLRTAAELILDPKRDVPATLALLLARDRGRLGGTALDRHRETEERRFTPSRESRTRRHPPSEPRSLPESDRTLARDMAQSVEELKAARYHLAVEWLRLKNDFFSRFDPLAAHEKWAAWLVFRHWETHGRFPDAEPEYRWHAPSLRSRTRPDDQPSFPSWISSLPAKEWIGNRRPPLFSSPVVKDHPLPSPPQLLRPGPGRARALYEKILKPSHASQSHES
jgi:hypothetical protein